MPSYRPFALGIAGAWLALALPSGARDLLSLAPGADTPGPGSPAAQAAPDHALRLPIPFDTPALDRVYWDFPLRRLDSSADSIAIDLTCDDPAALRAITLHLQSEGRWLAAQKTIEASGRQTLTFRQADFTAESGTPEWRQATLLRISAWKGAPRAAALDLHAVRSHTHAIAILRGSDLTAPGETGLAAQCAARAQNLFDQAGLPAALLTDDLESLDLRPYRLLILPYNPALSDRHLDILERYVRRRGRLAVFYHASPRLAKALGFELRPYATQSENWTTISFDLSAVPGLPATLPHITRHLLPVRAAGKTATTLGHWLSPEGRPSPHLPAAAVSPRGLWFSHIPPLASPSAVQWLLASLAAADPAHRSALETHRQESRRRDAQAAARLADAPPAPGTEIRAVWALPLPVRIRHDTLRDLAARGITTVFEPLATLADDIPLDAAAGRRISRALASARTNHLSLHAWVVCWSLDGLPADRIDAFRAQGRLMQDANGGDLPWLSPAHPANRALLLDLLTGLARHELEGLHLDYIRYPARQGCFAPATRTAFERFLGRPVDNWPAAVLPGGFHAADYDRFRRDDLTAFVAEVRQALRDINPTMVFSAAVYPTPESAAENGQDWPRWLREDLVDFVSPMLYTAHAPRFADWLDTALAAAPAPGRILPGIGTGADESQLDALATAEQILATRNRNTAGFALFQLDSDLLSRILPPLQP